jgi:hypothetical protein
MGEGVALLQELAIQEANRRNDQVLYEAFKNSKRIPGIHIPIDLAQWKMMSPEAQEDLIEHMRASGHTCLSTMLQSIVKIQPPNGLDYSGLSLDDLPQHCLTQPNVEWSTLPRSWPAWDSRASPKKSTCDIHNRLDCPTCA